jgi:hypothetical protein
MSSPSIRLRPIPASAAGEDDEQARGNSASQQDEREGRKVGVANVRSSDASSTNAYNPAVAPDREGPDHQDRPAARLSAGDLVGDILAGIEHFVTGRPTPPAQIEELYADPWASVGDMTIDGLESPIARPEPPDRSGARL